MGILKDLFVAGHSIEDEFCCELCNDVLDDPVMLDPCEHTFCKPCVEVIEGVAVVGPSQLESSSSAAECPVENCHQKITGQKKPSKAFMGLLNKLKLECPHEEIGCTWKESLGEFAAHLLVCDYNLDNWRVCDTDGGCGAKFKKEEEEDHNCVKYLKAKLETAEKKLETTEKKFQASQRKVKVIEKKLGKSQERVRELELMSPYSVSRSAAAAASAKFGWSKDWKEEDEEDDEEDKDTDYVPSSGSGRRRRQSADPVDPALASSIAKRGRGRPPGSGKKSSKGKKSVKKSSDSVWNSARGKKLKSSPK